MNASPRTLRIALGLPMAAPGDVDTNLQRMRPHIAEAGQTGADVILFSEGALTGYDLNRVAANAAIPVDHDAIQVVADLAAEHGVAVIVGFYERDGDDLYNSALALFPDGKRVLQRKHSIIDNEKATTPTLSGPAERTIFEVAGVRCAILICADTGIRNVFPTLAQRGCEAVLIITAGCGREAWGFHAADLKDAQTRDRYLELAAKAFFPEAMIRRAIEHEMAIACVNQLGWIEGSGYFHPGHGMVIGATGNVSAFSPGRFVFEHLAPECVIGDALIAPARSA